MKVRIPASSANLGPGFDALGVALQVYLTCRFSPAPVLAIRCSGRDAAQIACDENNLIWLKDMIEHLSDSREQLEWAQDGFALRMITESMMRDLDCCKRLCESLRRRGALAPIG